MFCQYVTALNTHSKRNTKITQLQIKDFVCFGGEVGARNTLLKLSLGKFRTLAVQFSVGLNS